MKTTEGCGPAPSTKEVAEAIEVTGNVVSFDLKKTELKERRFSGYASLRTRDRGGDVVEKGAFGKVVAKNIVMLKDHDPTKVIGIWHIIKEDDKGLYVEGELLEGVQDADETLIKLRKGAVNGMSIGFRTVDVVWKTETQKGKQKTTRHINKLELWEISVVTFPMHQGTKVSQVKALPSKRNLEKAMRDAGLTRKQACALLSNYKALTRDAKASHPKQADDLTASIAQANKALQQAATVISKLNELSGVLHNDENSTRNQRRG